MPETDPSPSPAHDPALGSSPPFFDAPAPIDEMAVDQSRINFSSLLKIRWAAVTGQLCTVLAAALYLNVELRLGWLLSIIGFAALTNAALVLWFRRQLKSDRWRYPARRAPLLIGSIMVLDILLLTALLYVSGGTSNPFIIFYFVNLTLAGVMLRGWWAFALGSFTVACYTLLSFVHLPLPALGDLSGLWLDSVLKEDAPASPILLYLEGILVAFGAAAIIVIYFIIRVSSELAKRELDLSRARQRRAQSEKLEALATLSAGAAHELSSPLSTIAVVAKDLEVQLDNETSNVGAVEDARLIRDEVTRCRNILDQMSAEAGQSVGEKLDHIPVSDLIESTLEGIAARDRVHVDGLKTTSDRELHVPRNGLARVLRAVLQNAIDASPPDRRVVLQCRTQPEQLVIRIWDHGSGMSPEILARADHPFFTTKEPGRGMGLGLFLARTTVERLGGSFRIRSVAGTGTLVIVALPWEQGLENGAEEV